MRTRADDSSAALIETFLRSRRTVYDRWLGGRVLTAFTASLSEQGSDVRAATEAHVVSFLASLECQQNRRGRLFSSNQRRKWLGTLRGFYRFLDQNHLVLIDPTASVRLPYVRHLPPLVLSEAQARRLMAAPFVGSSIGQRDRAILEVLYGTGLRLAECVQLDLQDVGLSQGQLLVRNGKGRVDRLVPLVGAAARAVDVYLRDVRPGLARSSREEALFLSRDGKRLSRDALQARVAEHGRTIRLRVRLRPHLLRHACATHLLRGGADIRHVQRLLGHKNLRTTAIYTHADATDLKKMIERAHPRGRRGVK